MGTKTNIITKGFFKCIYILPTIPILCVYSSNFQYILYILFIYFRVEEFFFFLFVSVYFLGIFLIHWNMGICYQAISKKKETWESENRGREKARARRKAVYIARISAPFILPNDSLLMLHWDLFRQFPIIYNYTYCITLCTGADPIKPRGPLSPLNFKIL